MLLLILGGLFLSFSAGCLVGLWINYEANRAPIIPDCPRVPTRNQSRNVSRNSKPVEARR